MPFRPLDMLRKLRYTRDVMQCRAERVREMPGHLTRHRFHSRSAVGRHRERPAPHGLPAHPRRTGLRDASPTDLAGPPTRRRRADPLRDDKPLTALTTTLPQPGCSAR